MLLSAATGAEQTRFPLYPKCGAAQSGAET